MPNTIPRMVERIAEGNLVQCLAEVDPIETWETPQEVWRAWQSGVPVQGVNTASLSVGRLVDGQPVFNLLAREGNLFIPEKYRQKTYDGIVGNDFFVLSPKGDTSDMFDYVMAAIKAGNSVEVPYSGLTVLTKGCGPTYGYVLVGGNNTTDEKRLVHGVYGENPGNGKQIYLLRKEAVQNALKSNPEGMVVRACWFYYIQDFGAYDRIIYYLDSAVRGVRRIVAEGDAQKLVSLTEPDLHRVLEQYLGPAVVERAKAVIAEKYR